jgi:bacillithiol biosynthesis cysteine-adding enzyme BshC
MQPSCVRHDQIPGTRALWADYLYEFPKVSAFFPFASWDIDSVVAAATVNFPAARRAQIVAALAAQNDDPSALGKLAQTNTVAIVTGQQVGFLLGPAYTIFKALTAVKLAAHLNEQGISAVPIFWLATEDHDLAEVDHAWVFNQDATPSKISLAGSIVNGGPVGDVALNEIPLAELRAALGDLPFADDVVKQVAAAYQPGASTLGSAFRKLLEQTLKGLGLLYLDPLAAPVREIAAPFLSDAVQRVPELLTALRARNAEIVKAGYHTQVHVDDDSSLFFLLKNGRRSPVRWKDGRFSTREAVYSAADLAGMAAQLSPNALLRPVLQDYLLPSVANIAGPAEVAYLAQSATLYQSLLGRMPVIYPRNGFTLLDARASKLLSRYRLQVTDLLDHHENVKGLIASRLVPPGLTDRIKAAEAAVAQSLAQLQAGLLDFDPTLEAAARKSTDKITYQFAKLERKIARETMRRDERATKDATYLLNLIYPQRHLQERFYSILPFLAKHGPDLPQRLLEQVQLNCPDHMLRTF